jgi:predicted RNase H-like nuclease (RuvC/YqgF family)
MTDIMKLARDLGDMRVMATQERATLEEVREAEAALQSAIEALRVENEQLNREIQNQYRCIKSHAQVTQKAEAERDALALQLTDIRALLQTTQDGRNADVLQLQSQLDAMGKGEAIYQFKRGDGSWFDQTKASYDYNVKCGVSGLRIVYAAPKALAPLTDEQIEEGRKATFSTDNPYCPCDTKTMRKAVQWAERKHGIHAKGGQQ